jgi:hypothetical protein
MPLYSILNNQQRGILQMPLFISHNSGICFCPLMQQPVLTNSSTSIGHKQLLDTVMLPRYQLRHLIVSNQLKATHCRTTHFAGQQPVTQQVPAPPSTQQSAKKKAKRSLESSISKKTKNSQSKRRGSSVKSIDKLASSIVTDEANSAAAASSSSMMPMFLALQMQQQA